MPYVTVVFAQLIPAVPTMGPGNPPTLVSAGATTLTLNVAALTPPPGAGTMQRGLPSSPVPPPGGLPAAPAWLFRPGDLAAGDSSSTYWARAWIPDTLGVSYVITIKYGGWLLLGGERKQVTTFTISLTVHPGGGQQGLQVMVAACSSPSARVNAYPEWTPNEYVVAVNFNAN